MRRSPENKVFADRRHDGGLEFEDNDLRWNNINSDEMRPAKTKETGETNPNLPHVDGRYAKFGDHIDDFVAGFEDYAKFLLAPERDASREDCSTALPAFPSARSFAPPASTTCCCSA